VRAGAAYVPVDPSYPASHLRFLLSDVSPRLILASAEMRTVLESAFAAGELAAPVWSLHEVTDDVAEPQALPDRLFSSPDPADPIYVMYTSGSSGRPKGVVIPHRAVARLVVGQDYCTLTDREVVLHLAPLGFDASTFEIWGALLNGGCLALVASDRPSVDEIARAICEHGVTTAWLTAGLFHLMVNSRLEALTGLHQLLAGGDVLSPDHVRRFLEAAPQCRLINGYGPTENTTFTCCATIRPGHWTSETVPIGCPITGTRIFVVDDQLMPVEPGAEGQLAAAGQGLAIGYLRRPELTRQKFVDAPFPIAETIYLTGDLVRELENGEIEFLGRLDGQFKIAGKRVEPGEIEQALRDCDSVSDAAIVIDVTPTGVRRILGFIAVDSSSGSIAMQTIAGHVKMQIRELLAEHLWPSAVIPVEALPITVNGKIDRHALLALSRAERDAGVHRPFVRNGREDEVAALWRTVLGLERVGLDESFFDLGGKSLQVMEVHAALERMAGKPVEIVELFARPTVRLQAALLVQGLDEMQTEASVPDSAIHERAERRRRASARWRLAAAG
jgi:amino acid adenylation domain-containing protein